MQNKYTKKGFSLIEVIVAISVITMVVLSSSTLLVSIVRSNSSNINRMIAYGLVQEGLEAMRNMRDGDWLLNASFDGKAGKFQTPVWGAGLPALNQTSFYTVEAAVPLSTSVAVTSSQINSVAPWNIQNLSVNEVELSKNSNTQLYKVERADGITIYTYKKGSNGLVTPFHRYLKITALPYGASGTDLTDTAAVGLATETAKFRVTSVVAWSEFGRDTEVRLDTELTDWKQSTL